VYKFKMVVCLLGGLNTFGTTEKR